MYIVYIITHNSTNTAQQLYNKHPVQKIHKLNIHKQKYLFIKNNIIYPFDSVLHHIWKLSNI
jgi:hypothetical protein